MADDNDEGTDADVIWAAVGVVAGYDLMALAKTLAK